MAGRLVPERRIGQAIVCATFSVLADDQLIVFYLLALLFRLFMVYVCVCVDGGWWFGLLSVRRACAERKSVHEMVDCGADDFGVAQSFAMC